MNFDKLMREEIAKLDGRKKLLLHCCCAPCSSACLERLKDFFDVTVLFYNPNIEDGEYERRKAELIRLIRETGWAEISDCGHDTSEFYTPVKGLENEKEGGARCEVCFNIRLKKTRRNCRTRRLRLFYDDADNKPFEKRRAYKFNRRKATRAREVALFRL